MRHSCGSNISYFINLSLSKLKNENSQRNFVIPQNKYPSSRSMVNSINSKATKKEVNFEECQSRHDVSKKNAIWSKESVREQAYFKQKKTKTIFQAIFIEENHRETI